MQRDSTLRRALGLALWSGGLLLSACGGGGGASDGPPPAGPLSLSGTAAVGQALGQANVQAKCVGGSAQTQTAADGSYSLSLVGASLPCVLRASTPSGRQLHSVTQDQGRQAVAHITPLTELLLVRAARQAAASSFDGFSAQLAARLDPRTVEQARAPIVALLNGIVDTSAIASFVRSPLKPALPGANSSDPHDQVLERLAERLSAEAFASHAAALASHAPLPDPIAFKPELTLPNSRISVVAGGWHTLEAHVNYPPKGAHFIRPPLVWSVVDTQGGTLRREGRQTVYTAPSQPGNYQIQVRRDDYAGVSTTLNVQVTPFVPLIELPPGEHSVALMPGQSHPFEVRVNSTPGPTLPAEPISWQLMQPQGGSITPEGLYTAPQQAGTYQLRVSRSNYPTAALTVEIRVGSFQSLGRHALPLQTLGLKPEQTVIRDAAAWSRWQAEHHVDPRVPADRVDFSRHMVLAIVWPTLPMCASADVQSVQAQGSSLQVAVLTQLASPTTVCTAHVWNPVWLLVVPRSELPLVVKETVVQR